MSQIGKNSASILEFGKLQFVSIPKCSPFRLKFGKKYFCLQFGKFVAFVLHVVFPDFSLEESENTFSFANLFWLRRHLSGWASRCSASHAASHHRMPWFKLFRNGLSLGKALFISSRYKLRYGSFKLRVFRVTTVALFSPFQIRLESVFPQLPNLAPGSIENMHSDDRRLREENG